MTREPWPNVPEARRAIMRANKRRDTEPELAVRRALHRRGLRYRVDEPIKPSSDVRAIRPDVVFSRQRIAVFVDSCWWHACPEHSTVAKTNSTYWAAKLVANQERDRRQTRALEDAGWTVVRAWTHESPESIADRVERLVREAS